jgi:hypothetical protein
MINYRQSPLSQGSAGQVRGGDRLPWVAGDGDDNFSTLATMTWQVHIYGSASAALARWCFEHQVALTVFEWGEEAKRAGFARDALYLLRPDTYVALADASGSPEALDRYFAERGLRLIGA